MVGLGVFVSGITRFLASSSLQQHLSVARFKLRVQWSIDVTAWLWLLYDSSPIHQSYRSGLFVYLLFVFCLLACLFCCLSACFLACLFVCLFVYLSVCLFACFFLSFVLSLLLAFICCFVWWEGGWVGEFNCWLVGWLVVGCLVGWLVGWDWRLGGGGVLKIPATYNTYLRTNLPRQCSVLPH